MIAEVTDLKSYDDHVAVRGFFDRASKLTAIIAVHRFVGGRAGGGTRFFPYADLRAATADVLRLSSAMTMKYALAGVACGGGKAVIVGDPRADKSVDLLHRFGEAIESFAGSYFAGPDIGTSGDDMRVIAERTAHVRGLPERTGESGLATATGVHHALRAAVRHRLGADSLAGLRVAIQGVGGVGGHLARRLADEGASLIVADVDAARADAVARETGAALADPDAVLMADADVLAPCALGGVISAELAAATRATVICGGANNQLVSPAVGATLMERGILFVPDYVANAGGVIVGMSDAPAHDPATAYLPLARIEQTCGEIFTRSDATGQTPEIVAQGLAAERLKTFA